MKFLAILVILAAVGVWATYNFGGFKTLDPAAQAAKVQSEIKTGMTWEQVADISEPRKLYPFDHHTINGERQGVDFDRSSIAQAISKHGYPEGFAFKYQFSNADAFEVAFNSEGKVNSVHHLMTSHDLLTGQNWKH